MNLLRKILIRPGPGAFSALSRLGVLGLMLLLGLGFCSLWLARKAVDARIDTERRLRATEQAMEAGASLGQLVRALTVQAQDIRQGGAGNLGGNPGLGRLQRLQASFPELRSLALLGEGGAVLLSSEGSARRVPATLVDAVSRGRTALELVEGEAGGGPDGPRLLLAFPLIVATGPQQVLGLLAVVDVDRWLSRMAGQLASAGHLRVSTRGAPSVAPVTAVDANPAGGRDGVNVWYPVAVLGEDGEAPIMIGVSLSGSQDAAALAPIALVLVATLLLYGFFWIRVQARAGKAQAELLQQVLELVREANPTGHGEGDGPPLPADGASAVRHSLTRLGEHLAAQRAARETLRCELTRQAAASQVRRVRHEEELPLFLLEFGGEFRRTDYVGEGFEAVFGVSRDILRKHPGYLEERVLPEDLPIWQRMLAALQDTGLGVARLRILREDRSIRWLQLHLRLLRHPDGLPAGVWGWAQDASMAALQALRLTDLEAGLQRRDQILAASGVALVVSDMRQPGQPVVQVSPGFERLTGYGAETMLGLNCRLLQGGDIHQTNLQELGKALGQGEACTVLLRNYRRDGSAFWNRLSVNPLRNPTGELTHYLGVLQDVTREVELDTRVTLLADELQSTRELLAHLPGAVWDWDIATGGLSVGDAWRHLLGWPEQGEEAATTLERFAASLDAETRAQLKAHLRACLPKGGAPLDWCHPLVRVDGSRITVRNRGQVIARDGAGRALRMVGTVEAWEAPAKPGAAAAVLPDPTLQGALAGALDWALRMDAISTLAGEGCVYLDEGGRVRFANPAFEAMTGLPAGALLGAGLPVVLDMLSDLQSPGCPALDKDEFVRGTDEPGAPPAGLRVHLAHPAQRWVSLELKRMAQGHGVLYLRDLSDQEQSTARAGHCLQAVGGQLAMPVARLAGYSRFLAGFFGSREGTWGQTGAASEVAEAATLAIRLADQVAGLQGQLDDLETLGRASLALPPTLFRSPRPGNISPPGCGASSNKGVTLATLLARLGASGIRPLSYSPDLQARLAIPGPVGADLQFAVEAETLSRILGRLVREVAGQGELSPPVVLWAEAASFEGRLGLGVEDPRPYKSLVQAGAAADALTEASISASIAHLGIGLTLVRWWAGEAGIGFRSEPLAVKVNGGGTLWWLSVPLMSSCRRVPGKVING